VPTLSHGRVAPIAQYGLLPVFVKIATLRRVAEALAPAADDSAD
jgi:hypothetical protein